MAKRRVNLYLDGEVFDRVKALCEHLGEVTPSAIANEAFTQFDAMMTPVLEKALAGDKEAAFMLFQSAGLGMLSDASGALGDVHTEYAKSSAKARAT